MRRSGVALVALLLLLHRPAMAGEIALSAGTTGAGISLGVPLGARTTLGLAVGAADLGRTATFDDAVIDVVVHLRMTEAVRLRALRLSAERALGGAGVRAVAGVVWNGNAIDAHEVPADSSVSIGGTVYPQGSGGDLSVHAGWPAFVPLAGLRYDPPGARRWHPAILVAALFQGPPRVDFAATGAIAANQARFQPYYDAERTRLVGELAPVRVFPVVEASLRLRR